MPEGVIAKLDTYCNMVRCGKPAACLPLQTRYVDAATSTIEGHGLRYHIEELALGWATVWVYKYPHILNVIEATRQAPKTAYDHWVLGKLFGYSEEAIRDFVGASLPS